MRKILYLPKETIANISKNAYILSKNYTWENYSTKIAKELELNTQNTFKTKN